MTNMVKNNYRNYLNTKRQSVESIQKNITEETRHYYKDQIKNYHSDNIIYYIHNKDRIDIRLYRGLVIIRNHDDEYVLLHSRGNKKIEEIEEIPLGSGTVEYIKKKMILTQPNLQLQNIVIKDAHLHRYLGYILRLHPSNDDGLQDYLNLSSVTLTQPSSFFKPFTSTYDALHTSRLIDYPCMLLYIIQQIPNNAYNLLKHNYASMKSQCSRSFSLCLLELFLLPLRIAIALFTISALLLYRVALTHADLAKHIIGLTTRTIATAVASICIPASLNESRFEDSAPSLSLFELH